VFCLILVNKNGEQQLRQACLSKETIHSKERAIIHNVVACFDKEAKEMKLSVPVQKSAEWAMLYVSISLLIILQFRSKCKKILEHLH
jgi:hypothetical protein